jgi:hypothetical protein
MWSWHWSPLTITSLLLSPSGGLALFLKTTLANGVKVVKKVITSKFRFHLIAIYALGCFRNVSCTPVPTKITLKSPPTLVRLVKEWFLMLLKKNHLIWKLFIYWYLMSFFHKKNVTKCLGHHYAIWTSDSHFLLAHFRHCTVVAILVGEHDCQTQFWKRTIQWLFHQIWF